MTDHRIRARDRRAWYEELAPHDGKALLAERYLEDLAEEWLWVPFRYEVCPTCEGKGKHVNPSIDAHGISREEFADDPDFEEGYMRGDYDVTCYECGELRVVAVPDWENIPAEVREMIESVDRADAAYAAEVAAERRYCGEY
jgi:hypothetical protein